MLDHIARELAREKTLAGVQVTVTAGPTQEALDPVRYLTNHSSGRMGYAIAREAMLRGAQVTLVSGPVDLPLVPFVETRPVTTAADMFRAVRVSAARHGCPHQGRRRGGLPAGPSGLG